LRIVRALTPACAFRHQRRRRRAAHAIRRRAIPRDRVPQLRFPRARCVV